MQTTLYNQNGEEVGKIELPEQVFGVEIKPELIRQVYVAQMANMRKVIAHTKARGEVRGGGRKPWRQKGTGRARHGSIRSPIWKGGGVTFGPTKERNFKQKVNIKLKRKAILMAFSGKARDNELIVLDKLEITAPKTKEMGKVVDAVVPNFESALLLLAEKSEIIERAARNINAFKTISVGNINIVDLLNCKFLVITHDAIEKLKAKYKD